MRLIYKSEEYEEFYISLSIRVQDKIEYILQMVTELNYINSNFIKKIINTPFYEIRVSAENEYRIMVFTIDSENFMSASKILLMNGFIKKSKKDYKTQIAIAHKIINKFLENE